MAVPPEDFAVVEDVEDFVVVPVTPATFPETPAATLPAALPGIERMPKSIDPQGNKEKLHFSIIASAALPHPTAGLMLGLQYKGWGGYVKGMSNFTSAESTYTCLSDGTLPDGSEFWGGGKNNLSINVLTAGAMFPVIKNLSFRGIAAEAGITANWRSLTFSAGVTTVKFKTIQVNLGVGIRF